MPVEVTILQEVITVLIRRVPIMVDVQMLVVIHILNVPQHQLQHHDLLQQRNQQLLLHLDHRHHILLTYLLQHQHVQKERIVVHLNAKHVTHRDNGMTIMMHQAAEDGLHVNVKEILTILDVRQHQFLHHQHRLISVEVDVDFVKLVHQQGNVYKILVVAIEHV